MMNKEGSNQIANFITHGPGTGALLLGREHINYIVNRYEQDIRFWNKLGENPRKLTKWKFIFQGKCQGAFIKIGCFNSYAYFLISENLFIDIQNANYLLVSENHLIIRYQKRNIWCQKIIFDIRTYKGFSYIKNSNFWYRICDIKKSKLFHDIRKWAFDIKKKSIFWYPKMGYWY